MQILLFMVNSYFIEEKKYRITGYKMSDDRVYSKLVKKNKEP